MNSRFFFLQAIESLPAIFLSVGKYAGDSHTIDDKFYLTTCSLHSFITEECYRFLHSIHSEKKIIYNNKISVNANNGKSYTLNILDKDENYIISFPNRKTLTVNFKVCKEATVNTWGLKQIPSNLHWVISSDQLCFCEGEIKNGFFSFIN